MKYSMIGELKEDIYQCNGRYPLDDGECYTRENIESMFELEYKKGTKLYRVDDGGHFAWYFKNGDGGWTEWKNIDDYLSGKEEHTVLSNLKIIKDNRRIK